MSFFFKKKTLSQLAVPFVCVPLFTPHPHFHHQLVFMPDTAEGAGPLQEHSLPRLQTLSLFSFLSISLFLQSAERVQNTEWEREREGTDRVTLDEDGESEGWIYSSFLSYGSEVSGGKQVVCSLHWPLGVRSPMFFTRRWLKSASSPRPRGPCTSGLMRPWRCRW